MKQDPPLSSCVLVQNEPSDLCRFDAAWEPLIREAVAVALRKIPVMQPKLSRKVVRPGVQELAAMASVDWKGAKWEAYHSSLSIPQILTILKGFGPMELLRFEYPGRFKGELSLCLSEEGSKEITLYHLEVCGKKRIGIGRQALRWLREIFKGAIFLEFPDSPDPAIGFHPTMPFWFEMYREGLVDALDCENFYLAPQATSDQIEQVQEHIEAILGKMVGCLNIQ